MYDERICFLLSFAHSQIRANFVSSHVSVTTSTIIIHWRKMTFSYSNVMIQHKNTVFLFILSPILLISFFTYVAHTSYTLNTRETKKSNTQFKYTRTSKCFHIRKKNTGSYFGEMALMTSHLFLNTDIHITTYENTPTGSYFGEMALMTSQPRSASVVCSAAGGCAVDEISGEDFANLLLARPPGFRRDVTRMLRARQFRHGVYKLLTELGSNATFSDEVRT